MELVFKDGQWQPARLAGIDLSQPIPSITSSGMQLHGSVLPRGSLEMARTQDTDSAWLRSSTPLPSVRSSVPKEGKQQALPPAPGRDRGG